MTAALLIVDRHLCRPPPRLRRTSQSRRANRRACGRQDLAILLLPTCCEPFLLAFALLALMVVKRLQEALISRTLRRRPFPQKVGEVRHGAWIERTVQDFRNELAAVYGEAS